MALAEVIWESPLNFQQNLLTGHKYKFLVPRRKCELIQPRTSVCTQTTLKLEKISSVLVNATFVVVYRWQDIIWIQSRFFFFILVVQSSPSVHTARSHSPPNFLIFLNFIIQIKAARVSAKMGGCKVLICGTLFFVFSHTSHAGRLSSWFIFNVMLLNALKCSC